MHALPWWVYAVLSACAAAATAILAKLGVSGIPSTLATAFRTAVVLVFAVAIVIVTGEHRALPQLRGRPLLFLTLSGVATGLSWLAYFRALQLAPASRVAPIDKMSLGLTIALAAVVLGEPTSWRLWLGATMIVTGALLTLTG
jgi:transporter family protein